MTRWSTSGTPGLAVMERRRSGRNPEVLVRERLGVSATHATGNSSEPSQRREEGAILLLALVFILLISLSVLGLLTFGGTGIKDAASLQGQRSLEYAADGAVTAAIQSVRYSSNFFSVVNSSPTSDCLPNGALSMSIDNDAMVVGCSGALSLPVPQQKNRVVSFYACLGTANAATGATTCSSNNSIVAATVDFQDISSTGLYDCPDVAGPGTCGTGITIVSWVVFNTSGNNN
jgi:hypothetical protein